MLFREKEMGEKIILIFNVIRKEEEDQKKGRFFFMFM